VPLATTLLSHGLGLLFLLWYVTPRDYFEQRQPAVAAAATQQNLAPVRAGAAE